MTRLPVEAPARRGLNPGRAGFLEPLGGVKSAVARGPDKPLDDQPDRAIARRRKAAQGHVEDFPGRRRDEADEYPSEEDIERFSGVTAPCRACGTLLYDDVEICWNCGHDAASDPARGGVFGRGTGRILAVCLAVGAIAALLLLMLR